MAEQQDEKPRLPLAGIFALLALVSSFLIYQEISLQTSRPISKGTRSHFFVEEEIVQSRLWQDPFEAVEAHRRSEPKGLKEPVDSPHQLSRLVDILAESGVSSELRVLPVFVDGSPYSSGAETRLNDRYAVVSAFGAAGYVPESGEYIRFFVWNRGDEKKSSEKREITAIESAIVPVELFIPKAKLRDNENKKHVLVLWLKAQDFGRNPLMSLSKLIAHLDKAFEERKIKLAYNVLGPRFSTGLSAMVEEIKSKLAKELQQSAGRCPSGNPPFNALTDVHFYSPWATAQDTFLLDDSPDPNASKATREIADKLCNCPGRSFGSNDNSNHGGASKGSIEKLFACAGIKNFSRTIGTDAVLAQHLVEELNRRRVDLGSCPEKDSEQDSGNECKRTVALISEWDTLYGRSLPRTFAAIAAVASTKGGSRDNDRALDTEINKLRRDEWPKWISHHSYLAGLDGELPSRGSGKTDGKDNEKGEDDILSKGKAWYEGQSQHARENAALKPEGRGQLDYVVRLAEALKKEEANNVEFKAIGVLGGDVYDKLLILQALRAKFPRAVFFTTDLNARLAYPDQWESTRNLIIASHFGLELQPALQTPIPPFRDSYQTSLFYAALMALEHLVPVRSVHPVRPGEADCQDCVQLSEETDEKPGPEDFLRNTGPRLYEIGRSGAFDISTDPSVQSPTHASIHPPRPDMDAYFNTQRNLKWLAEAFATVFVLVFAFMLISSRLADFFLKLAASKFFWLGLIGIGVTSYSLVKWVRLKVPDVAESEPFVLTEGISAWPTAAVRLIALITSLLFLWYSWRKMKNNENFLTRKFDLENKDDSRQDATSNRDATSDNAQKESHLASLSSSIFSQAIRRCLGLHVWRPDAADKVDAVQLWREYVALGDLKNFAMRGLPQVSVALCFAWLMMILFGFPYTPCRGTSCFLINDAALIISVTLMMTLIFYVVDATRLCRRWVNCIAMKKVRWPDGTLTRIAAERNMNKENLDEWLGIEVIAERTAVIGNFIYFPFIIIILLGLARHGYLDNWDFPVALVIIFALNAIIVVGNTLALRRSAETAKREAIKRLEGKLIQLSDQSPEEIRMRHQIEWDIHAIKNNKRGAFLPFTQHPVFGAAIALPSGGYGLVLLLEYMATGL